MQAWRIACACSPAQHALKHLSQCVAASACCCFDYYVFILQEKALQANLPQHTVGLSMLLNSLLPLSLLLACMCPAGKGSAGKPASAHMEHLLSSFLRATPSAAAAAAAQDWDTADGYDWEADEAGAAWDPMDCDAAAMGMCAEGEGQQGGTAAGAGSKGKGAGKKGRGPAGAGGARKGKGSTGAGAGRKAGGVKKKGAGRKPRVQKQAKKAVGVGSAAARSAAGGAKAAAGARGKAVGSGGAEGGRKPGVGNKQAKKDPWETDSGASDSE